ncbi:MAG: hypothetical protein A2Z18_02115 [Armatimonadetes bacterium RBG_16_58_9]|nr:MAG: hypothetical protein A2Z18_02115 [Armatimonadetes bacterium RBG_16_58_9]
MFKCNRKPDFEQFLKVLKREGKPTHLPFYEHYVSPGFIERRMGVELDLHGDERAYWRAYVDFWMGMGYDCVPMEVELNCRLGEGHGAASEGSEARAVIRRMRDYENYDWPDESNPIDFRHFETVAGMLPEGAKIVGGVGMGPYEWVSQMMGVMGLSYAIADDPNLVDLMFDRVGNLIVSADRQIATMDAVGALRQGDDLGFKTSTFLPPYLLRKYVFPIYERQVAAAHANGKPFVLHSCGNLAEVYDDLIDDCKIDAKHSFEDVILPVGDFKRLYGSRVTAVGGLDVDFICRHSGEELRAYTRKHIEECFDDGYWALGTGNSLTDYMPVENYLACLDEGLKVTA